VIYSKLFQYILFPSYERLRDRKTLRYLKIAEKNQWLSEDEIKEFQWGELKRLLRHAYENVPFYRDIFQKEHLTPDDIKTPDDFRCFPTIDRETVRENRDKMISEIHRGRTLTKATGGSTGIPLQFEYTRDSYEWRRAIFMRGYGWAGYKPGDKVAYLWSVPVGELSRYSRLKMRAYHLIQREKYLNVFDMTPENMISYLKSMRRFKPKHIVAYGLQMYHFAKFIKENSLSTPPIDSIIIGAEKVYPDQIELIKSVFKCDVFNTYGCREFMLIASECEMHNGMHVNIDNLYVEILKGDKPAEPGEMGKVVITDLHNYGMPFIRYELGDVAIPIAGKCPCGRGLPLIKSVEGRFLDLIVTPEGKIITGVFFPHLMKEFKEIRKYQVIQRDRKSLMVKLALEPETSKRFLMVLRKKLREVIGDSMEIKFDLVDDIPLNRSGKFRTTISKLPVSEINKALKLVRE